VTYKLVGRKIIGGQEVLVDPIKTGGANAVIAGVSCQSSVFVGAAVYMTSGGVATNAIATSLTESNVIGIVEAKATLNECTIRVSGTTESIYSSLDVTKEYFLSDSVAGEMITIIPTASGHIVLRLGQPYSEEQLLFMKGNRVVRAWLKLWIFFMQLSY